MTLVQFQFHSTHQSELEHLGESSVYLLCVWLLQPLVWDVVHSLSEVVHDLLRGPSLALGGEGRGGEGKSVQVSGYPTAEILDKCIKPPTNTFSNIHTQSPVCFTLCSDHTSHPTYLLGDEHTTESSHQTERTYDYEDVRGSDEMFLNDGQQQQHSKETTSYKRYVPAGEMTI